MQIQEFREKNPQYNDLSNSELGFSLWNKHYKDDMNLWEFAERFNPNADDLANMRQKALDQGLSEIDIAGDFARPDKEIAKPALLVHGQTLGLGPEVQAAVMATANSLGLATDDPQWKDKSWGDFYSDFKSITRREMDDYRKQYPLDALGHEMMGAISSPVGAVKLPGFLGQLPTSLQATIRGFIEGTIYGTNESEDKSLAKGIETGVVSGFFTAGTDKLIRAFKPASKTVKSLMNLRKNPTLENLSKAKRAAYKEVDAMGPLFGRDDIMQIWQQGNTTIKDRIAYNPAIDKTVKSIETQLRKYIANNKMFKLSELDNIRKDLFRRQSSANENEKIIIGKMINKIDDIIDNKPIAGPAMKLARDLHGKFMKTKQLDDAFHNARRSAESSGTGGNMYNLYKSAVKNILNSPKKSKYFTQIERDAMENFVKTKPTEKVLRILSKASPDGNGLIFFLTATAATMNPAALSLTAAGYAAKRASEKGIKQRAGQLIEDMASGTVSTSQRAAPTPGIPTLMSVTTGSPTGLDNPAEGLIDTMIAP